MKFDGASPLRKLHAMAMATIVSEDVTGRQHFTPSSTNAAAEAAALLCEVRIGPNGNISGRLQSARQSHCVNLAGSLRSCTQVVSNINSIAKDCRRNFHVLSFG